MGLEVAEPIRPLTPQEYGRLARLQPAAASARLGWSGLEALLFNNMADAEIERPPLTHHELVLFKRLPDVFAGEQNDSPPRLSQSRLERVAVHDISPPVG